MWPLANDDEQYVLDDLLELNDDFHLDTYVLTTKTAGRRLWALNAKSSEDQHMQASCQVFFLGAKMSNAAAASSFKVVVVRDVSSASILLALTTISYNYRVARVKTYP